MYKCIFLNLNKYKTKICKGIYLKFVLTINIILSFICEKKKKEQRSLRNTLNQTLDAFSFTIKKKKNAAIAKFNKGFSCGYNRKVASCSYFRSATAWPRNYAKIAVPR